MSFLDDTYCQLCERFITKEQWNKHLYSSRHLHKKAFGYCPAYFPQRRVLVYIFYDDNKYERLFRQRKRRRG